MKKILLVVFLLGAWGCGTVFMWSIAMQNFQVVDEILMALPGPLNDVSAVFSVKNVRLIMRYQASEANRLFFEGWGMVQIAVAVMVLLIVWKMERRLLLVTAALPLVICLILQFYVVPETIRLGRIIDFLPRNPSPPEAIAFWRLHHIYTGLDMTKFIAILGLSATIFLRREYWTSDTTRSRFHQHSVK